MWNLDLNKTINIYVYSYLPIVFELQTAGEEVLRSQSCICTFYLKVQKYWHWIIFKVPKVKVHIVQTGKCNVILWDYDYWCIHNSVRR